MASTAKFDVWQNTSGVAYGTILQRQVAVSTAQIAVAAAQTTMLTLFSVTITPRFATSRIWLFATLAYGKRSTGEMQFSHRFLNGASNVTQQMTCTPGSGSGLFDTFRCTGTADSAGHFHTTYSAYDQPNTTSAVTYNFQIAAPSTYQIIYVNFGGFGYSNLIAEEMAQ